MQHVRKYEQQGWRRQQELANRSAPKPDELQCTHHGADRQGPLLNYELALQSEDVSLADAFYGELLAGRPLTKMLAESDDLEHLNAIIFVKAVLRKNDEVISRLVPFTLEIKVGWIQP